MMLVRRARPEDLEGSVELAAGLEARGDERVREAFRREQLLVARDEERVVGCLAYRTDWFDCTFVTLAGVAADRRRRGVARALYGTLETVSTSPRIFSSAEETNAPAIRMHSALGFRASGHLDNLPQGYRQLIFFKRRSVARGPEDGGDRRV
jgi:ribosomal protein S18 acetylase RimI-like enzyme